MFYMLQVNMHATKAHGLKYESTDLLKWQNIIGLHNNKKSQETPSLIQFLSKLTLDRFIRFAVPLSIYNWKNMQI